MRTWTTEDRPPAQQYPYWREVLCEAFTALDPVAESVGSFESTVAIKDLLDVTVSDVRSRAQTVFRSEREIRRNPSEYFFANMQLEGSCIVKQDGRETLMRPGDFYIVDTTRSYDLVFEDWRILCIRMPRHLLMPRLKAPRAATAVRLHDDGALGTVAGSFMRSLLHCSEAIPPAAQLSLVDTLANLLSIALGATTETREHGKHAVRETFRDSIAAYVATNIANPELCVNMVASRFQISPRYLHKLFEDQGQSFSQRVQESRLERCTRDLADTAQGQASISEIAYRWGFNDLSNFCRVFQKRYGMSAGDFRRRGADAVR
ncbi:helix-turn-helix domain-containing protein [Nevskia ramosa]|uniref:helix-turn-helix domain-containing protein n=1 Tax=Nevskia ramosa TaxID=64002 RepID=UPI0023571B0C|nr:helix-turn-helix domain-containing protein [Nevskia ramosa]